MDAENRRYADTQKNLRKSERHVKELTFTQDEDRKNSERLQALIDQLQGKIKAYKKQIEEAEEIAALNLAKYRQVCSLYFPIYHHITQLDRFRCSRTWLRSQSRPT